MDDGRALTALQAEWAIWGKAPGARDYGVLSCTESRFSRDQFGQIFTRFSPGTPQELPQVSFSWAGGGSEAHLGVAIQEWSGHQDVGGREVATTYYFAFPFEQVGAWMVSYESLYDSLTGEDLYRRPHPAGAPLDVQVRAGLDVEAITAGATPPALASAALLLTGDPVCVTHAEAVPLRERLRFLDASAALLPFGFRSRLTASTWTNSSSRHEIKLSFATDPRGDARVVNWQEWEEPPASSDALVWKYYTLLRNCDDLPALIRTLAADTQQRDFTERRLHEVPSAAVAVRTRARRDRYDPAALSVAELIETALRQAREGDAELLWDTLDNLRKRDIDPSEQDDYREIACRQGLFSAHFAVGERLTAELVLTLVAIGYEFPLTLASAFKIVEDAGRLTQMLLRILLGAPAGAPAAPLILTQAANGEAYGGVLVNLSTDDLMDAAYPMAFVAPDITADILGEIIERGGRARRAEVAEALVRHGQLADSVEVVYQESQQYQFEAHRGLLAAAYGEPLAASDVARILAGMAPHQLSRGLFSALAVLGGPGTGEAITQWLYDSFCCPGMDAATRKRVKESLVSHMSGGAADDLSRALPPLPPHIAPPPLSGTAAETVLDRPMIAEPEPDIGPDARDLPDYHGSGHRSRQVVPVPAQPAAPPRITERLIPEITWIILIVGLVVFLVTAILLAIP